MTPWSAVKSRRGAMGRILTQPFACPNRRCAYYRITDAQVHALVGDGAHGRCEPLQTLRCQACGTTFSTRRGYPLGDAALSSENRIPAGCGSAHCSGSRLSVAAAVRVFGHRHATITTWLTRAGTHSATLYDRTFRHLHLLHIQFDELRTRLRCRAHTLWLWVAVDPFSKIIPVLRLGPCTQDAAHRVVHDLSGRLAPGCIPIFTSDGLNLYFYALTAHFGQWVAGVGRQARQWQVAAGLLYGQVKKTYRRRKLVRVTAVLRCGTRARLRTALQGLGFSGRLNTAFVERLKKDSAAKHRGLGTSDMGDHAGGPAVACRSGMVVCILPLRATAPVAPAGAGPTNRAWRPAAAAALSATDARDGRRADKPALEGMRGADAPAPTGAARRWIRAGDRGRAGRIGISTGP